MSEEDQADVFSCWSGQKLFMPGDFLHQTHKIENKTITIFQIFLFLCILEAVLNPFCWFMWCHKINMLLLFSIVGSNLINRLYNLCYEIQFSSARGYLQGKALPRFTKFQEKCTFSYETLVANPRSATS